MIVSHRCQCCPTILIYDAKWPPNHRHPCFRKYCEPCRKASIKASKAKSCKIIRERFGRNYNFTRRSNQRGISHVF